MEIIMTNLILRIDAGADMHHDDLDEMTNDLAATLSDLEIGPVERVKTETITEGGKSIEEFIVDKLIIPIVVKTTIDLLQPYIEVCVKEVWQWTQRESRRLGREVKVWLGEVAVSSTMTWVMAAQQIDRIKLQSGE